MENAVGGNQPETAILASFRRFQIGHVVVGIAEAFADNARRRCRGMVQRIEMIASLRRAASRTAAIGVEAGAVEDSVIHPEEGGDRGLELLVLLLRAADEPHRRHAVAIAIERLLGSLAKLSAVGKAKIVVGAEVQHLVAAHLDLGRLRRGDHPLRLVESRRFQPFELAVDMRENAAVMIRPVRFGQTVARAAKIHRKSDDRWGDGR